MTMKQATAIALTTSFKHHRPSHTRELETRELSSSTECAQGGREGGRRGRWGGERDEQAVGGGAETVAPASLGLVLPQTHRRIGQLAQGHARPRHRCPQWTQQKHKNDAPCVAQRDFGWHTRLFAAPIARHQGGQEPAQLSSSSDSEHEQVLGCIQSVLTKLTEPKLGGAEPAQLPSAFNSAVRPISFTAKGSAPSSRSLATVCSYPVCV